MKGWQRSLTTLAGAVVAGALIWFIPHFDRWSTGGYWAGMALFALAGLVLGVAQLRGREGNSETLFLGVFLPILIVTGWVLLAAEPQGNWFRDHAVSWSGDIGLGHVVHNLAEHVSVLAFGLGLVFGLTFEAGMIRRRVFAKATVAPVEPSLSQPVAPAAPIDEPTVVVVTDEPTIVVSAEQPTVVTSPEEPTVVASPEEPTVVASPEAPTVVASPEEPTVVTSPEEPIEPAGQPDR